MENFTIRDLEQKGLGVTALLSLLSINDLDGNKLRELCLTQDSDFNTSFENEATKKVQFQSLLNNYSSEVKLSDLKTLFTNSSKATTFLSLVTVVYRGEKLYTF